MIDQVLRLKRQGAVKITVGGLRTAGGHDRGEQTVREYEVTRCLMMGSSTIQNSRGCQASAQYRTPVNS